MSELKATTVYDAYWKANSVGEGTGVLVYLKSEADKVIAEKEADYKEACDRLQTANLIKDEQLAATRHQKYKRCLAVARRCHGESLWWYSKGYGFEKYDKFWEKWEKRWLELAVKFKEVK